MYTNSLKCNFMSVISRRLKHIYLACDHNNVRHGKDIEFENSKYQQSGTIIQQEHHSKYKQYNNTSKITYKLLMIKKIEF
jgi:hypothetical protein